MSTFSFCQFKSLRKIVRGSLHIAAPSGGTWVIFNHGLTGHRIGPGYLYVGLARALAASGISSLRFDFAGSGESEGAFSDMTTQTMVADLNRAIIFVKKRFAPSRIILLGHSLGGCIAAIQSGTVGLCGLALLAPVGDPMGLARRRESLIRKGPNANGFYENGPHEMSLTFLEALRGIDPVAKMARRFRGGLLVIQGDADQSISVRESGRYIHAATKAGIVTAYHVVKGADHNFSSVAHHSFIALTLIDWIKGIAQ